MIWVTVILKIDALKMDAMNDLSLSSLYRRLTAARAQPGPDAETLVTALAAETELTPARREALAAELAVAPDGARLVRLLRTLQPESAALSAAINASRRAAHRERMREPRRATRARRGQARPLRWAGAVAACLAVAVGVFAWHEEAAQRWANVASAARSVPLADRIFTTRDRIFASSDMQRPVRPDHDRLFRGTFAAGG